ncbi:MAG: secondary thiamine-phosphate synthase enzyme YjbQ [Calditrichia bacterium]
MLDVKTEIIQIPTKGFTDIIDITPHLTEFVNECGFSEGQLSVFVPGSTAGLTHIEYEPGLLRDLPELLERLIPSNKTYHHDDTWHDGNGYAHLRSALIKSHMTFPFYEQQLILGTWQQIILVDFDNRPRQRKLVLQAMGKK